MTEKQAEYIKRAYNYLLTSSCVEYNNDTAIRVSKEYVEYTLTELIAGREPLDKKEAGFRWAGMI